MEKWEEEGFASEEAYNKYQQTIKELKEKEEKLNKQVEEKQKLIDSNRTKISDLSQAETERDELKAEIAKIKEAEEKAKLEEEQRKKERTPEVIGKTNEERIKKLSKEERDTLAKEYKEATEDQKKILSTPEGMEAYLDLKLKGSEAEDNPFAQKEEVKPKDIKDQVAEIFHIAERKSASSPERKGIGFNPNIDLKPDAKKSQDRVSQDVDEARGLFL